MNSNPLAAFKAQSELNQALLCSLCGGYLIDAMTIIECIHSFCRSCILTHFARIMVYTTPSGADPALSKPTCPKCGVALHETKPQLDLRSDSLLQSIVYKLVPGLWQAERNRRIYFQPSDSSTISSSPLSSTLKLQQTNQYNQTHSDVENNCNRNIDDVAVTPNGNLRNKRRSNELSLFTSSVVTSSSSNHCRRLLSPIDCINTVDESFGADQQWHTISRPEDRHQNVSLEMRSLPLKKENAHKTKKTATPFYLLCPALLTIEQLQRLLSARNNPLTRSGDEQSQVEIYFCDPPMHDQQQQLHNNKSTNRQPSPIADWNNSDSNDENDADNDTAMQVDSDKNNNVHDDDDEDNNDCITSNCAKSLSTRSRPPSQSNQAHFSSSSSTSSSSSMLQQSAELIPAHFSLDDVVSVYGSWSASAPIKLYYQFVSGTVVAGGDGGNEGIASSITSSIPSIASSLPASNCSVISSNNLCPTSSVAVTANSKSSSAFSLLTTACSLTSCSSISTSSTLKTTTKSTTFSSIMHVTAKISSKNSAGNSSSNTSSKPPLKTHKKLSASSKKKSANCAQPKTTTTQPKLATLADLPHSTSTSS